MALGKGKQTLEELYILIPLRYGLISNPSSALTAQAVFTVIPLKSKR
jgi:hypothetical protein